MSAFNFNRLFVASNTHFSQKAMYLLQGIFFGLAGWTTAFFSQFLLPLQSLGCPARHQWSNGANITLLLAWHLPHCILLAAAALFFF